MQNAQKIWDKLLAAGFTPAGAAGLMGNLQAESGLVPTNLQNGFEKKLGFTDADYTAAVDCGAYDGFVSDGAGYGLAQWTYPSRKAALLAYAKARGRSIGDLDMQVDFLLQELQSLFPRVLDTLRAANSIFEASDCVLLQFERPANRSTEVCARRAQLGQGFFDLYGGGNNVAYLMTAQAFCAQLLAIANGCKTAYMLGPWGWPATTQMITRATTQGSNAQTNRQWLAKANAIKGKGFLFDCVGLIKGILWGWMGDLSRTYGGAGYACNGVPDYDAKQMINHCREVSTDFSTIVPAEAVWMDGHIGVYVGNGVVVEATPKWQGGVQCSTLANTAGAQTLAGTAGYRTWTKHGKLPWVDYSAADKPVQPAAPVETKKEDGDMDQDKFNKMFATAMKQYRQELRDNDSGEWSREARQFAVDNGIFTGNGAADTDDQPNMMWEDLLTREQCAQVMYRFAQKFGLV